MNIKAPRGTKDIYGETAEKFQKIITAADLFKRFEFEQIITPIFESTQLFTRSIGEATDIVEKEMYTFEDKGGRSITLRPEGTASIVRSYIEHKMHQDALKKFYYYGPMFRYERPQAGRYREFFQMGVEAIGEDSPKLDAEIIYMAAQFLKTLGINNYSIEINSLGCENCRKAFTQALTAFLESHKTALCSDCNRRMHTNPLRVLDCKQESCKTIFLEAPTLTQYLDEPCRVHFSAVLSMLSLLGIKVATNEKLVRGLDYYTKTVFEFVSTELGSQGTILAGGRYNNLVEEISGSVSQPAFGWAAGMERLSMLMPYEPAVNDRISLCWLGEKAANVALKLKAALVESGFIVAMTYEDKSLKAQMKRANKDNIGKIIIIGDTEIEQGVVQVKNFETKEESTVDMDNVVEFLRRKDV